MPRQKARHAGEETRLRILDQIGALTEQHGRPPTVREIVSAVGARSTGHVSYHLTILEDEGKVRHAAGTSRGFTLVPSATPPRAARPLPLRLPVPVMGAIAAGEPIEAVISTDPEDKEVDLASDVAGQEGVYALRVRGDSMIDDHILNGDVVLVRAQDSADNGDIVVALLDADHSSEGVVTLKRLYREKDGRVRLQPANAAMAPIFVPAGDLRIRGKVIGIYRHYRRV